MTEHIDAQKKNFLQPFLKVENWSSFNHTAEQSMHIIGRKIEVNGIENIPEGAFNIACNHTLRVDNPVALTGKNVTPDILTIVGKLSEIIRSTGRQMYTVITDTPQPRALWPKGKNSREMLHWMVNDAGFGGANILRRINLAMYKKADDLLVAHYEGPSMNLIKKAMKLKQENSVMLIFPEGKTTAQLEKAKPGFGEISRISKVSTLPVGQFDDNGVLKINIGQIIEPNTSEDNQGYVDLVMKKIASLMPIDKRGEYR